MQRRTGHDYEIERVICPRCGMRAPASRKTGKLYDHGPKKGPLCRDRSEAEIKAALAKLLGAQLARWDAIFKSDALANRDGKNGCHVSIARED